MTNGLVRLVNRVGAAMAALGQTPPAGVVMSWRPEIDAWRTPMTPSLSFAKLKNILQQADDGQLTDALQLFAEMEQLDPRLKSVASTRRAALTGLPWEITSAADVMDERVDKTLADEAATYVRERLDLVDGFDRCLEHLATAIGPNLAVAELIWEAGELAAIAPIPRSRLAMDLMISPDVRVLTEQERTRGVVAATPKFITHVPQCVSGSPLSEALHKAVSRVWLMQWLALMDWATFCELFGMPTRVGKYTPAATPQERTELANMLKNMGAIGYAVVSQAVSIEMVEATARGVSPHQAMIEWCDRQKSVLFLGANLTSDSTGGTGTLATAKVHDDVREDLRNDDMLREARTIREQLLAPMVHYAFPNRNAPPPFFTRVKPETIDRLAEANVIAAAQRAGLKIPKDWAHARLNIPIPEERDDVLEPSFDAFAETLREPGADDEDEPRGNAPPKGDEDEEDDDAE